MPERVAQVEQRALARLPFIALDDAGFDFAGARNCARKRVGSRDSNAGGSRAVASVGAVGEEAVL
jgi:hypothetical protein